MRRHTTYNDEDLRDATRRKGEKVPEDKQHESTIYSFRTQEQDTAATGFQRFLSVLNKGVDINKLSKIVNNVNELPPIQEGHPKTAYRSEYKEAPAQNSQDCLGPQSRALPQDNSHSHIRGERRPDLPHGQLQSLLESIGLDLGVEELGRLSDRTKEKLYGMKRDQERSPLTSDRHSSTRDWDRERDEDTEGDGSKRNGERDRDRDWASSERDRERDGDKSERDRDRRSNTRDRRSGPRDRHSSTRDRDRHSGSRDRDRHSGTRDSNRDRRSSTRDSNRDRRSRTRDSERDRHSDTRDSERDRPSGTSDRGSSTRDRDEDRRSTSMTETRTGALVPGTETRTGALVPGTDRQDEAL
ncbi:probable splicing factor, arginine/serine-rich 7 [Salvelinus sp. IW2-2015]|uniref:probable splicing factor, arginine/serine-rich 7 n=1 Tax=Salvelinus sp. IW2-2015 TaxID=2691554 RepID=UPI0038D4F317